MRTGIAALVMLAALAGPFPAHATAPDIHAAIRSGDAQSVSDAAKAWAFHDRVFADRAALAGGDAYLRRLAADLGADLERLDRDLEGGDRCRAASLTTPFRAPGSAPSGT